VSIRHVVLFEHKNADAARIQHIIDALNALPAQIDWIREWSITEDLGHRPGSSRFCLIAVFDNMDAMNRHLEYPAHQAAVAIEADVLDKLAEHDHAF
jgi:Stress responsive A/B Barrel Domain